jgi:hypothetical protein
MYRGRIDNTTAKRKGTKNDVHNTTQEAKNWAKLTPLLAPVE